MLGCDFTSDHFFVIIKKTSRIVYQTSPGGAFTMHNHCINKLIDLKDIKIKNIIHSDSSVKIFIETVPKVHSCPSCGKQTKQIHDYRKQTIKDLPFQLKNCYLILNKRRYRCTCGKRFFESYHFLAKYQQRTTRLTKLIAKELGNITSIKAVAQRTNVSVSTVSRILDTFS